MMTTLIIGLLIPLLGTMLGSAFVFFFYLCTVGIQRQYTLTAVNKRTTCFSRFALLYELVLLPHNVCFCSDCLINCKET